LELVLSTRLAGSSPDVSETDPQELAASLEREADKLEQRGEDLADHVHDVRQDWQRKRGDVAVPGAVPEPSSEDKARVISQ
jgi:hypothetical protein